MAREIDVATYLEVTSTLYNLLIKVSIHIYKTPISYFVAPLGSKTQSYSECIPKNLSETAFKT